MISTNCIMMNRSNKPQNRFCSGIPTRINWLHAHQNIPNKGFSLLSTCITTHNVKFFKTNAIKSKQKKSRTRSQTNDNKRINLNRWSLQSIGRFSTGDMIDNNRFPAAGFGIDKEFPRKWKFWKWVVKKNKVERILCGEWEKLRPVGRKGKTWGSVYRDFS